MRTPKILLYLSVFTAIFTGCKEDTREGLNDAPDKAKIAVMQLASPVRLGSSNVTAIPIGYFYNIDGKLAFSQPLVSNRTTGYRLVDPGSRTLTFDSVQAVINVNNSLPKATVKTININAVANTYYSVYLSGKVQAPDDLVTTDDLTRPAGVKAKIRFVHLSPDGPAVDFAGAISTVAGPRPIIIGNRSYKTSSDFVSIDAGLYTFELRGAGSATPITTQSRSGDVVPLIGQLSATNVQNFNQLIEPGKIYTFIARGYVNPIAAAAPIAPSTQSQPVFPLSVTGVINSYF